MEEQLIIVMADAERAELADLADATGQSVEEAVLAAVRGWMQAEREKAGSEAARLAGQHAGLLRRLGE
ncbi:hypothetical protein M8Z33_38320 [Streptomyces sp. ZAF1911]|uniref:hypothetical protein n=1 Tax=Streptomyces sp. ZAF1911 TaxID=2944129 RepID=UPI00237BBD59|nr:hypothetical protein [Streptomyces sp. ZAF1911]MDD9382404.1 hypothetical protein [Streptomyces sp. ZAF1911]